MDKQYRKIRKQTLQEFKETLEKNGLKLTHQKVVVIEKTFNQMNRMLRCTDHIDFIECI